MTMAPIKKMPNMPPICALKFELPNAGPMKRDDVIMHPATIFHFLPLFACKFRLNVRSQAAPPRDWPGLWGYHHERACNSQHRGMQRVSTIARKISKRQGNLEGTSSGDLSVPFGRRGNR